MSSVSKAGKVAHAHRHHHHTDVKQGKRRVKKGDTITQELVQSDIKANSVRDLVLRASQWTSDNAARWIIKRFGEEKLNRIVIACENIWKLSDNLGMTKYELFKLSQYIETKLPRKINKGKAYLRKEHTGLARTIEFKSHHAFIHLKEHGISGLGKGCHKKVTRSIMYAAHKPEIVANCVGDKTVYYEGKLIKKLGDSEGIVKTYAVSEHLKKKSRKKVYSLITKLYNAHTVRSYEYNRSLENRTEEMYIARDLMKGLEHMHTKKKAHCDLHSGNFMVHREAEPETGKVKVSAALIDFGQVKTFNEAKKRVPRVEVAHHLITPESLVKGKHRVDVRKVESYAVGCSLYHLFFGLGPEWCDMMREYRVKKMSKKAKKTLKQMLTNDIKKTIRTRKAQLDNGDKVRKRFGKIIMKLLTPNPKARFTPLAARKRIDHIIQRMEAKKAQSPQPNSVPAEVSVQP